MSGFNFQQIADTISAYMDTDYIDIRRNVNGELKELYSNIPCHISYSSTDNPDPYTADIKPINQHIFVHTNNYVDIQNDDFIVCKKTDNNGALIAFYEGRCGFPVVSQSRKKVLVSSIGTNSDTVTANPPLIPITITINCVTDSDTVLKTYTKTVEKYSSFKLDTVSIEQYELNKAYIGETEVTDLTDISIASVTEDTVIKCVYSENKTVVYLRYLVNGLYTKNDGTFGNGYHLYKKIPIASYEELEDGSYKLTCTSHSLVHSDTGKELDYKVGDYLQVYTLDKTFKIDEIDGNTVTVSSAELPSTDVYVTEWYD